MAMATGCAGSALSTHDASRPTADAPPASDPVYLVLPDGPLDTPADVPPVPVEAQPLPHESCVDDGGQALPLDASCDAISLVDALRRVPNWYCDVLLTSSDGAYAVVIDCDGRVIELLKLPEQTPLLSEAERQAWLDSLANDRWPCFAGQSVQFTCMVCLFPP